MLHFYEGDECDFEDPGDPDLDLVGKPGDPDILHQKKVKRKITFFL